MKIYLIKYTLFSLPIICTQNHFTVTNHPSLQLVFYTYNVCFLKTFVINIDFNFNELFLLSELFGVKSKMCLESKSRRSNASGEVWGVRIAGSPVAHRWSVLHGSDPRSLVPQRTQATKQLCDHENWWDYRHAHHIICVIFDVNLNYIVLCRWTNN